MWRFHLESQKSPNEVKMASGCEWEWVAKCNDKLHTECFFRLFKEKGLQVTDLQCLRRNTELPEHRGGRSTLIISLVSIREQDAHTAQGETERSPGLALQPRVNGQRGVSVPPLPCCQPGPCQAVPGWAGRVASVVVVLCLWARASFSRLQGLRTQNHPMTSQVLTYTGHTETGLAADSGLLLQPVLFFLFCFISFNFIFFPLFFSFFSFLFFISFPVTAS